MWRGGEYVAAVLLVTICALDAVFAVDPRFIPKDELAGERLRRLSEVFPGTVTVPQHEGEIRDTPDYEVQDSEQPLFSLETFETLDNRLLHSFFKPYRKEASQSILAGQHRDRPVRNPSPTTLGLPASEASSLSFLPNMNELNDFHLDMDDTASMMKLIAGTSTEFKKQFLTHLLRSDREGLLKLFREMIAFHMKGEGENFIPEEEQNTDFDEEAFHLPPQLPSTTPDQPGQFRQKELTPMTIERRIDTDVPFDSNQGTFRNNQPFINSAVLLHKQSFSIPARFGDTGSVIPIQGSSSRSPLSGPISAATENINIRRISQASSSPSPTTVNNRLPTASQIQAIVDKNGGALDVFQLIEILNGIRGTPMFDKIMDAISMLVDADQRQQSSSQLNNLQSNQQNQQSNIPSSGSPTKTINENLLEALQNGQSAKSFNGEGTPSASNTISGVTKNSFVPMMDSQIINSASLGNREFEVAVFDDPSAVKPLTDSRVRNDGSRSEFSTTIADLINNESPISPSDGFSFPQNVEQGVSNGNTDRQLVLGNALPSLNQQQPSSVGVPLPNFNLPPDNVGQVIVPLSSDIGGQLDPGPVSNFQAQSETQSTFGQNFQEENLDPQAGAGNFVPLSTDFEGQFTGEPLPNFMLTQENIALQPDSPDSGITLPADIRQGAQAAATSVSTNEFGATENDFALQSIGVRLSPDDPNAPPSGTDASNQASIGFIASGVPLPIPLPPSLSGGIPIPESDTAGQAFGVPLPDQSSVGSSVSNAVPPQTGAPLPISGFSGQPGSSLSVNQQVGVPLSDANFDGSFVNPPVSGVNPDTLPVGVPLPNPRLNSQTPLTNIGSSISFTGSSASDTISPSQPIGVPLPGSGAGAQPVETPTLSEFDIALSSLNQGNNELISPAIASAGTPTNIVTEENDSLLSSVSTGTPNIGIPLPTDTSSLASSKFAGQGFSVPVNTVGVPLPDPNLHSQSVVSTPNGPVLNVPVQFSLGPGQRNPGLSQIGPSSPQISSFSNFSPDSQLQFSDGVSILPASLRNRFRLRSSDELNSVEDLVVRGPNQPQIGSPGAIPRPTFNQNQGVSSFNSVGVPLPSISSTGNSPGVAVPPFLSGQLSLGGAGGVPLPLLPGAPFASRPLTLSNVGVPLPSLNNFPPNSAKSVPKPASGGSPSQEFIISKESLESFSAEDGRLRIKPAAKRPGMNYDAVDENGYDDDKRQNHKFVTFLTPGLLFPYGRNSGESSHSTEGSDENGIRIPSYSYTVPPPAAPSYRTSGSPCDSKTVVVTTVVPKERSSITTYIDLVTKVQLVSTKHVSPVTVVRTLTQVRGYHDDSDEQKYRRPIEVHRLEPTRYGRKSSEERGRHRYVSHRYKRPKKHDDSRPTSYSSPDSDEVTYVRIPPIHKHDDSSHQRYSSRDSSAGTDIYHLSAVKSIELNGPFGKGYRRLRDTNSHYKHELKADDDSPEIVRLPSLIRRRHKRSPGNYRKKMNKRRRRPKYRQSGYQVSRSDESPKGYAVSKGDDSKEERDGYVIRTKLFQTTILRTITTTVPRTIVSKQERTSTIHYPLSYETVTRTSIYCSGPDSRSIEDSIEDDHLRSAFRVETPPLPKVIARPKDSFEGSLLAPTTSFKTDPSLYRTWVGTLTGNSDSGEDIEVPSKFIVLQHMWPKGFVLESAGPSGEVQQIRLVPADDFPIAINRRLELGVEALPKIEEDSEQTLVGEKVT